MSEFEIRTLAKGEVITEAGFYAIPLEQHHNQPCDGPSVTSGILRTMELETPADVWAFHKLNPDRWESGDSPALRLGRAIAAYIEGGAEELERHFFVLPSEVPRKANAAQIRAIEAGRGTEAGLKSFNFWSKVEQDPRDPLTEAEWAKIVDLGKVLSSDPAACAALGGIPEITMAWKDKKTGLWCLARPDQIGFDGMVSDYKSAATRGTAFNTRLVDRRITEYGIDMQMAFACEGFKELTGNEPSMVGLVFQLSAPPYHVILRSIEAEDISIAHWRNDRSRVRFAECLESGNWPGPGEVIGNYHRPDWQRERLLEEMNMAGTAP